MDSSLGPVRRLFTYNQYVDMRDAPNSVAARPRNVLAAIAVLLSISPALAQELTPPSVGTDAPSHSGLVAEVLAKLPWTSAELPGFHLHYVAGTSVAEDIQMLGSAAQAAHLRNLALLEAGVSATPGPIELFFVNSREEMAQLIGHRWGGVALVDDNAAIFVVDEHGKAALQHELMHVLSHTLWGKPYAPWQWINEGLGTFAPGTCDGYGFHALAAELLTRDSLPPLEGLAHRFFEYDDLHRYLAGASLVQYVRDRWGIAAVRALWQQGLEGGTMVIGTSIADLDQDWRNHLVSVSPAPAVAWDEILSNGCESPRTHNLARRVQTISR